VDEKQGILLNLGTAICGNAAIVVAAPMIRAEDRDVAVTIAIVNLMGVIAMFAFPLIGALLALSPAIYGMWCGLSIQVTAHVLAAGFAFPLDGDAAGQMATITKLTRISFLGPTVFIVAGWYTYRKNRTDPVVGQTFRFTQFIPAFVILFFVMVILRTIGCFPEVTFHFTDRFVLGGGDVTFDIERGLGRVSVWLITCGMAGIGLMTEFRTVREGGWRPVLLGVLTGLAVYGIGLALAMRQVRQAI
jgi:uncharacterized integral membrane protein (TIGR00698 family)